MKKLLLSSSFITIVVMTLNFIFKIFLAYKISKVEIGLFYTFMDMVAIGIMVFSGFKDSLIRAFDRANFEVVVSWYFLSFWSLFLIVLIGEILYFTHNDFPYSVMILLLLLFFNALMIFLSYLNAAYKNYKIMLFENLVATIGLLCIFFLSSLFISNIYALVAAFIGSFLSKILFIYFNLPQKITFRWHRFNEDVKKFLRDTALSSSMYFFSGIFISASGLMILKLFGDKIILAEYQVVVRSIFFSLVAIFVFPLNTFTFPQISKLVSSGMFEEITRIEKILQKYLLLFFIVLLIGTFFTKYAITLVFPAEYSQSYMMLNTLLPLLPLLAYTTFAINIVKSFDRFDLALVIRFTGALLFFISIYIFYFLGYSAKSIVWSLDISFIAMFLLSVFYKKKLLG